MTWKGLHPENRDQTETDAKDYLDQGEMCWEFIRIWQFRVEGCFSKLHNQFVTQVSSNHTFKHIALCKSLNKMIRSQRGMNKSGMKGFQAIFLLCEYNIFQKNIWGTKVTKNREVKYTLIDSELSISNCKYDSTSYIFPWKTFGLGIIH